MNEDHRRTANTLPFARPARAAGRGGDSVESSEEISEEMLDIVRQEPEMNISRTVLLSRQIDSGRYRVDASRVARRLLEFEDRLPGDQDRGQGNGGRSSSSKGRSSASSTSHSDASD